VLEVSVAGVVEVRLDLLSAAVLHQAYPHQMEPQYLQRIEEMAVGPADQPTQLTDAEQAALLAELAARVVAQHALIDRQRIAAVQAHAQANADRAAQEAEGDGSARAPAPALTITEDACLDEAVWEQAGLDKPPAAPNAAPSEWVPMLQAEAVMLAPPLHAPLRAPASPLPQSREARYGGMTGLAVHEGSIPPADAHGAESDEDDEADGQADATPSVCCALFLRRSRPTPETMSPAAVSAWAALRDAEDAVNGPVRDAVDRDREAYFPAVAPRPPAASLGPSASKTEPGDLMADADVVAAPDPSLAAEPEPEILAGTTTGALWLFSASGAPLRCVKRASGGPVRYIDARGQGAAVLCVWGRTMRVLSADDLSLLSVINQAADRVGWRRAVLSPHHTHVVALARHSTEHVVEVWDVRLACIAKVFQGPPESAYDVSTHPRLPYACSVTGGGRVLVYARPSVERWSAYTADFEELANNQEYREREDEFDAAYMHAAAPHEVKHNLREAFHRPVDLRRPAHAPACQAMPVTVLPDPVLAALHIARMSAWYRARNAMDAAAPGDFSWASGAAGLNAMGVPWNSQAVGGGVRDIPSDATHQQLLAEAVAAGENTSSLTLAHLHAVRHAGAASGAKHWAAKMDALPDVPLPPWAMVPGGADPAEVLSAVEQMCTVDRHTAELTTLKVESNIALARPAAIRRQLGVGEDTVWGEGAAAVGVRLSDLEEAAATDATPGGAAEVDIQVAAAMADRMTDINEQ
jgi:hypothetical protein